jgi:hypothetical protein
VFVRLPAARNNNNNHTHTEPLAAEARASLTSMRVQALPGDAAGASGLASAQPIASAVSLFLSLAASSVRGGERIKGIQEQPPPQGNKRFAQTSSSTLLFRCRRAADTLHFPCTKIKDARIISM